VIEANVADYDELFAEFRRLHDYFARGENKVMHHLRDLRRRAHGGE
jgi:L-ribulokinase